MSMLTLNGIVQNVFRTDETMDRKTGEIIPAADRVQIMAENITKNGEKRIELVDLTIDEVAPYREAIGKPVRVPVGVYVASGKPAFYALKKQQAAA